MMKKGTTSTGFTFEINEAELDNMEFLDALSEATENVLQFSKVVKMLLGESQRKALYDHLRVEGGKVPIESVSSAVYEIMELASEETKN